jgi:hypothetical protein
VPRLSLHRAEPANAQHEVGEAHPTAPVQASKARKRRLPLTLRRKGAARLVGVPLPTWDRWSAAGLTPEGTKVAGTRRYRVAELVAWVRHGMPPRKEWAPLWRDLQSRRAKH